MYAIVASAALHLGAVYGVSRVLSASRAASMPTLEFRDGDHAIEIQLIAQEQPEQAEPNPVVVEEIAEVEIRDTPPMLGKLAPSAVDESARAMSMIQDAAADQLAANETRQRIAQIVIAEARKAVGRMQSSIRLSSSTERVSEKISKARDVVEPAVEPPLLTVPPVVVKPIDSDRLPTVASSLEVARKGDAPQPDERAPMGRSGVTHGAKLLDLPTPRYPLASRRKGEEGLITLQVRVLADGRVEAVKILEGPKIERLRSAAIEAARRSRFLPAYRDGKPIASTVIVPIRFSLR